MLTPQNIPEYVLDLRAKIAELASADIARINAAYADGSITSAQEFASAQYQRALSDVRRILADVKIGSR